MSKPLLEVHFYGPANAGKTAALASLTEYLVNEGKREDPYLGWATSDGLRTQRDRLAEGAAPLKLVRNLPDPTKEAPADVKHRLSKLDRAAEWAYFEWPNFYVLYIAHIGQVLPNARTLENAFKDAPNLLFVGVLNPLLARETLARTAYADLIVRLQQHDQSPKLKNACVLAAELLFHPGKIGDIPSDQSEESKKASKTELGDAGKLPGSSRASDEGKDGVSNRESSSIAELDLVRTENELTRIHRDFTSTLTTLDMGKLVYTEQGLAVHGTGPLADPTLGGKVIKILNRIADYYSRDAVDYMTTFQIVLRSLPRSLVVISHADLAQNSTVIGVQEFFDLLDELFDNSDRLMSQQVFGGCVKLDVDYDLESKQLSRAPLQMSIPLGKKLHNAIKKQLAQFVPLPLQSEQDKVSYGDYLAESLYRAIAAWPIFLLVTLLFESWIRGKSSGPLPIIDGGQPEWGSERWLSLQALFLQLPATLLAVSLIFVWMRMQWGKPAWRLQRRQDETLAELRHLGEWSQETPPAGLQFSWSPIGRLLGFAFGKCRGNQLRRYPVPGARRLFSQLGVGERDVSLVWWKDAGLLLMISFAGGWVAVGPMASGWATAYRLLAILAGVLAIFAPDELASFGRTKPSPVPPETPPAKPHLADQPRRSP